MCVDMLNIVERARQYEQKRKKDKIEKKKLKDQHYKDFIADPNRPLPPLNKLILWRKILILITFSILAIPSLQILLCYNTIDTPIYDIIQNVSFFISMIFAGFAVSLDWAISKRFGNHYSIIQWLH